MISTGFGAFLFLRTSPAKYAEIHPKPDKTRLAPDTLTAWTRHKDNLGFHFCEECGAPGACLAEDRRHG